MSLGVIIACGMTLVSSLCSNLLISLFHLYCTYAGCKQGVGCQIGAKKHASPLTYCLGNVMNQRGEKKTFTCLADSREFGLRIGGKNLIHSFR